MSTRFQRPSGAYAGASGLANRTKYQTDSAATAPRIPISSAKVDGDINYAIDAVNALDDDLQGLVAGVAPDNSITNAKLRDSGACSVIGRSANSSGDPADISAASNDTVLVRASNVLSFAQVTSPMVADNAITTGKIADGSVTAAKLAAGAGSVAGNNYVYARNNALQAVNSTIATVVFGTEVSDTDGVFSSNSYTVPAGGTGLYGVMYGITYSSLAAGGGTARAYVRINSNESSESVIRLQSTAINTSAGAAKGYSSASGVLSLTAGDVFDIRVSTNANTEISGTELSYLVVYRIK